MLLGRAAARDCFYVLPWGVGGKGKFGGRKGGFRSVGWAGRKISSVFKCSAYKTGQEVPAQTNLGGNSLSQQPALAPAAGDFSHYCFQMCRPPPGPAGHAPAPTACRDRAACRDSRASAPPVVGPAGWGDPSRGGGPGSPRGPAARGGGFGPAQPRSCPAPSRGSDPTLRRRAARRRGTAPPGPTMLAAKEKAKAPKDSMTLLPCFYFVELPIVASSIITLYFLELTDLFKPAKVGFQCYDRALSMPYVETNEELIPLLMLLSLAFAAPAASIMVGEGIVYCLQSRLKGRGSAEGSINAGGCNFNSFLRRTVRFVGVHVFGLCATALVTDVIQLATGYHAPFFLTVCKPNYTLLGTPCDANPYVTQDICSGPDKHAILSARKTFPSQHATLSAFAAVYVSMYFNSIISDSTKLLKPILVFAFAIAAGICGLTQITQYRSHPVDVYVGFLIGAGIAAYLAYHAVGNFRAPAERAPAAPPAKDALRALTQRGHDSVYQQNKSVSTDELNPPGRLEGAARPVPREKNSLGSLKRASVDVDLLAPRSPMAKENMVTFSNTLPRVSTPSLDDPARRHMTIHVPVDASRSKQLITEWKQKSLEGRGAALAEEGGARGADDDGVPPSLYPTVQAPPPTPAQPRRLRNKGDAEPALNCSRQLD
nr:phospholipid phosphatase-related protein type 3 [Dromaius novaehollandiae]